LFCAACAAQEEMMTEPDCKPTIDVSNDLKPALNVDNCVMVNADTSPNKNRPEGSGFVQDVWGVGAATIVNVKEDLAFDNGCVHHSIPYNSITAAVYGQDFDGRKKKRIRVSPEFYNMKPCVEEDSCHVEEDSCLPSVKLAVQLMKEASANQKKGWLQEALGLSTGKHLNHTKNELLTHVMLLEEYIA
jgi:hypothetical protein